MSYEERYRNPLADISVINELHPLGDCIYDVREREGKGWEGPKVTAYWKAVQKVTTALSDMEGK